MYFFFFLVYIGNGHETESNSIFNSYVNLNNSEPYSIDELRSTIHWCYIVTYFIIRKERIKL